MHINWYCNRWQLKWIDFQLSDEWFWSLIKPVFFLTIFFKIYFIISDIIASLGNRIISAASFPRFFTVFLKWTIGARLSRKTKIGKQLNFEPHFAHLRLRKKTWKHSKINLWYQIINIHWSKKQYSFILI